MKRQCAKCTREATWRVRRTMSGKKFVYYCAVHVHSTPGEPQTAPYVQHQSSVKEF